MMKKVLLTLAAVAGMFCSCTKDLENRVAELEKKFAELEAKVNANVKSISDLVAAAESGVTINSVAPASDGNGYVISFSDGTTAVIVNGTNGTDGKDGADGHTPQIGFQEIDGILYWTVDGVLLKDGENNVPVTGAAGEDGKTPEFRINDNVWEVSFDGQTWTAVPVSGASVPAVEISETDSEYVFTQGTTEIKIPKTDAFAIKVNDYSLLVEEGSQIKLGYSLIGEDDSTVVLAEAHNANFSLDTAGKTITVIPEVPFRSGYILLKAVRNSDGKYSAQYINIVVKLSYDKFGSLIITDTEYNW
ncbi:MAG: DUF4988 domain-containing protein [Rikenellaceae bacterium]|nr:DUF4988 domain-containing protein [Rikenellaceae bacterium]